MRVVASVWFCASFSSPKPAILGRNGSVSDGKNMTLPKEAICVVARSVGSLVLVVLADVAQPAS